MRTFAHIQTPTPVLKLSQDFYRRIGFYSLDDQGLFWSDGTAMVEINPVHFARPRLRLFKESWHNEISQLKSITKTISHSSGKILSDPSGTWIYLDETPPHYFPEKDKTGRGLLGKFHGVSLESIDFEKSSDIYEALGFVKTGGAKEAGYFIYELDGFVLNLMQPLSCPHLFFNPSLTYFNGNQNLSIISHLRTAGVAFAEEITHFNPEGLVDNVILRDPAGLGFFVFSD